MKRILSILIVFVLISATAHADEDEDFVLSCDLLQLVEDVSLLGFFASGLLSRDAIVQFSSEEDFRSTFEFEGCEAVEAELNLAKVGYVKTFEGLSYGGGYGNDVLGYLADVHCSEITRFNSDTNCIRHEYDDGYPYYEFKNKELESKLKAALGTN